MISHCMLHIGTEKTGTTTIQRFLARNRGRLGQQQIVYPTAPGEQNHTGLAAYANQKTRVGGRRRSFRDDSGAFENALTGLLDSELRDSTSAKVLFSNEHLSSRVLDEERIRRVKALCDRYAATTKIIVYIRNQVDFLVSSFGTAVQCGGRRKFPFPLNDRRLRTMNYEAILARWRNVFGPENMIVRRFEAEDFPRGDLLADFASLVPFDPSGFRRGKRQNESLSARGMAFLRELNKKVPAFLEGKENPARKGIVGALRRAELGPRLSVSPQVADAIMREFEESNRRVSQEYFDGKFDPLFSPARSVGEADAETLLSLDVDQAMDVVAKLWAGRESFRGTRFDSNAASQSAAAASAEAEAGDDDVVDADALEACDDLI